MTDEIVIENGIALIKQTEITEKKVQIEPAIRQIVNAIGGAHDTITKLKIQLDGIAIQLTDEQIQAMSTETVYFTARYNDRFAGFVKPVPE